MGIADNLVRLTERRGSSAVTALGVHLVPGFIVSTARTGGNETTDVLGPGGTADQAVEIASGHNLSLFKLATDAIPHRGALRIARFEKEELNTFEVADHITATGFVSEAGRDAAIEVIGELLPSVRPGANLRFRTDSASLESGAPVGRTPDLYGLVHRSATGSVDEIEVVPATAMLNLLRDAGIPPPQVHDIPVTYSEVNPERAEPRLDRLAEVAGLTPTPQVEAFERALGAVQSERRARGRSTRATVSRTTALWTALRLDPLLSTTLDSVGLNSSTFDPYVKIDGVPDAMGDEPVELNTHLAAALSAHLAPLPRGTQLDLRNIVLAILRSATGYEGGQLADHLEEQAVDVPAAIAAVETLIRHNGDSEVLASFSRDAVDEHHEITEADDLLGIEDDVRSLCRLIASKHTSPPLAIGLFGDWGTGKSFFMGRMHSRLDELQTEAKSTLDRGVDSPYCQNTVQIKFTAWHYIDTDMWASLMARILEGLCREEPKIQQRLLDELQIAQAHHLEARQKVTAAHARLRDVESRRSKVSDAIDTLDNQALTIGEVRAAARTIDAELDAPAPALDPDKLSEFADDEDVASLRSWAHDLNSTTRLGGRVVAHLGRSRWWGVASALCFVVAIVATVTLGPGWGFGSLVAALATAWQLGTRAFGLMHEYTRKAALADELVTALGDRHERLQHEQTRLEAELRKQRDQLLLAEQQSATARATGLVEQFVRSGSNQPAYLGRLGVISLIRKDLETLTQLLAPGNRRRRLGDPDRIVLYIDDLDRCPPERVVEVLQAVHLLLAFPLFVVVVGVDPRWLLTSLETHYLNILDRHDGDGLDDWAATPADYIEKIFQIPLALAPMNHNSYGTLVRGLTERDQRDTGTPPIDVAPDVDELRPVDIDPGDHGPPSDRVEPIVPDAAQVTSFDVDGTLSGIGFTEGRHLYVATSEGLWDRTATDVMQLTSAPITTISFDRIHSQVAWAAPDQVVRQDLIAGTRRTTHLESVQHLVFGPSHADFAVELSDGRLRFDPDGEDATAGGVDGRLLFVVDADRVVVARGSSRPHTNQVAELGRAALLSGSASASVAHPEFETTSFVDIAVASERERSALYLTTADTIRYRAFATSDGEQTLSAEVESPAPSMSILCTSMDSAWLSDRLSGKVFKWRHNSSLVDEITEFPDSVKSGVAQPCGPRVAIWTDREVRVFGGSRELRRIPLEHVDGAAISLTGSLVATFSGGSVDLWRIDGEETELPGQLQLDDAEVEFLAGLGDLIPTARATKRVINVYRFLKASEIGRTRLGDPDTGDYRHALLLLGLIVGSPEFGAQVLDQLRTIGSAEDRPTWPEFLADIAKTSEDRLSSPHDHRLRSRTEASATDRARVPSVERFRSNRDDPAQIIKALQRTSETVPESIEHYVAWAFHIRRFSILSRPS